MSRLSISLACWNYDRTQALADGTIRPDGIDLNMQTLDVEETFFRMLRHREFDAAEMSLSSYCVSLGRPDPAFVAIPVFPSRLFRHSCIFVSAKSGIERPEDLVGKRIGVPEYQMTAPVWIRGILADEYGVDPASVTYHTGGEEQPGRDEKLKLDLPERFHLRPIGPGQTLSRMLADGEIDALHTARTPSTFYSEPDKVRRLFPISCRWSRTITAAPAFSRSCTSSRSGGTCTKRTAGSRGRCKRRSRRHRRKSMRNCWSPPRSRRCCPGRSRRSRKRWPCWGATGGPMASRPTVP
jgi:hypothetical protein